MSSIGKILSDSKYELPDVSTSESVWDRFEAACNSTAAKALVLKVKVFIRDANPYIKSERIEKALLFSVTSHEPDIEVNEKVSLVFKANFQESTLSVKLMGHAANPTVWSFSIYTGKLDDSKALELNSIFVQRKPSEEQKLLYSSDDDMTTDFILSELPYEIYFDRFLCTELLSDDDIWTATQMSIPFLDSAENDDNSSS